MQGAQQFLVIERFEKEIDRAAVHCGRTQQIVIARRHDNNARIR
jgi:hypothetical protein